MAVAAALTVTLVAAEPVSAATLAAKKAPVGKVTSRSDLVSARVTARAQGVRVEVEDLRDATSTTWANPDGTMTTEQHAGPIRFKDPADPKGPWRDVDLTMAAAADGTAGPKGHPYGLSLAGAIQAAGGTAKPTDAGAVTSLALAHQGKGKRKQDRDVILGWAGKLGTPVLSGTTATYKNVKPGVDLVVEARRTGYETHLVLNTPDALTGLQAEARGGPVSWEIPVTTKGLTARAEKDGSVAFVDADGQVASYIPAPVAWDNQVDPKSGNRVNQSPMTMTLTQKGAGRAVLTVTPDQDWLTSPDRAFPITLDPTYATGSNTAPSIDAYVSSAFATTNYATDTELRVGTYNGGGDKYRSFLKFAFTNFKNLDIASASLSLYEFHSYSCTAKPFYVYSTAATDASVTWNTQPGASTQYGSLTVAKGYSSSCAAGRVSVPITGLVDYWAGNAYTTGWLRLSASESDTYGWKKFYSVESSQDPYITFTYNRKPNAASAPTLQSPPGTSYVNSGNGVTYLYTSDSTPQLSSKATDPDASTVAMTIEVHNSTTTSSTSLKSTCTTAYVASGATGSCSSTSALADNTVYYARTAVKDDRGLWNGTWSAWTTFRTAIAAPPAPVISCPAPYTNGSWNDTVPSSPVPCTITAAGTGTTAPAYIWYSLDGAADVKKPITPSSDPTLARISVSVPNTSGAHTLKAYTWSTANIRSATTPSWSFGYGNAALSAPTVSPRVTTTGSVKIVAAGPPRGVSSVPTAKVRWRVASSGADETTPYWNDATSAPVTVTDNGASGVSVNGSWNAMAETLDATDTDPNTTGVQTITLNPRVPVLLDVQVCLTYTTGTQCTWSDPASKATIMRVPHAFGNGFPTADAGPGQVALFTGEFNTDATDASVPGYTGSISLSRSHSTYGNAPSVPTDAVTGVFGPGWTASLEGSDAGLGALQAVDATRIDGTIAFVDTDGTALVYMAPCTGTPCVSRRTTSANLTGGRYTPVDDDTELSGTTLTVAGSGASTTLTLTEDDGTKTVFSPSTATQAPTATAAGLFSPSSVTEPGSLTTTYTRDSAGRVTRILAPIPPGIPLVGGHTAACPDPGAGASYPDGGLSSTELEKGCRTLRITYGNGTLVGGVTPTLVKQVSAELYNPTSLTTKDCAGGALTIPAGMARVPVACYSYDGTNRLTSVKDPRTQLTTSYGYGSANQLTSITPVGQTSAPITLVYSTLEQRLKLTAVTRPQASPLTGTANLARIVYRVPTSGSGLPDLSSDAVNDWGQAKAPSYGAAVFGPDYTGTISQADGATPTASDWFYADLSYTTADGYTVNTASYGASAWQRTSTDYDDQGNIIRTLDAGAIAAITGDGLNPAVADLYATKTVYNADIKDTTGKVVTPAGTLVTDTYGPVRNAVMADGTIQAARPHTHTVYDEGAPTTKVVAGVSLNPVTDEPWRLPTTETITAADGAGTDIPGQTISTTSTAYTAQVAGTGDGWTLGSPTKVTTGGIPTITVYDSVGRTIQTRQPMSNGADAGTTNTVYYTADSSATDSRCDAKPEWAGLPCATSPAANATTTGTPANGPASLPASLTSGYSIWLDATTTVETSGTATRTSTTTMDAAGRTLKTQTTSTIPGSTSRPAVHTHYDPATGLADYTGPIDKTASQGVTIPDTDKTTVYDTWGRPVTSRAETATPGTYDTTTTTYDTAGRIATVTDPKGTTTTTYDGTDAAGTLERRGLPTKVTLTRAGPAGGTGTLNFTGAYDANGTLTRQDLPGGITQTTTFDEAGEPTGLSYDGQVTPVTGYDPDGNPIYGPPTTGTWLSWSQDNDITGRVRIEYTGAGSAFDNTVAGVDGLDQVVAPTGEAIAYDRSYGYDTAGRLVTVNDRTATTTGITLDPDVDPTTAAPCTTRSYGFDNNGSRTSLQEVNHADGNCAGTGGTTAKNLAYAYDTADRPTTAATGTINGATLPAGTYTYDAFGRQNSIPATDTPAYATDPDAEPITLGYYDDDLARTITQTTGGGAATTTLQLDSGGRRVKSTTVNGPTTTTLERHYADGSDNPAWTIATDALGQQTITRYGESIGGDLGTTISADGSADLTLANLHGDVVTTVPIAATAASGDACTGIDGWSDYTEYGTPRAGSSTATTGGAVGYGWLGAKQRSTTQETAGLTLMGDRLFNSVTGRFTALDPEPGGNDTAYTYPNDPINQYDLDGHKSFWKKRSFWKKVGTAALWGSMFIPGLGAVGLAVRGAVWGIRAYRIARAARSGADLARFGAVSVRTANLAGRFYTGRGSRIVDGARYSKDLTLRYRAPSAKVHSGKIQANFERTTVPGTTRSSWKYPRRSYNGHLLIRGR
jgi:hypothetical protein